MTERQLSLFTTRSILCERFDSSFFRGIPRRPGVYLMRDSESRIIYVGKAKDLRARLSSYRYADARCSRKTVRLIARVTDIQWQVQDSEQAALLEENRLLRELRPRFNRMNTWPKAYRFIRVAPVEHGVQLSLSAVQDNSCYGAFKGASREAFNAMLRLLAGISCPYPALPRRLVSGSGLTAFDFGLEEATLWNDNLRAFLSGEGEPLFARWKQSAPSLDPFHASFRAADLSMMEHFYRIGPYRNKLLRKHRDAPHSIIAQEDLDDWIVSAPRLPLTATDETNADR